MLGITATKHCATTDFDVGDHGEYFTGDLVGKGIADKRIYVYVLYRWYSDVSSRSVWFMERIKQTRSYLGHGEGSGSHGKRG